MDAIKKQVETLVMTIKESSEYQNFQKAQQRVASIPGLEERIREFCRKNYEIQNSSGEDWHKHMEEFEIQSREFRNHPVVAQYLECELQICRMFQRINAEITNIVELII